MNPAQRLYAIRQKMLYLNNDQEGMLSVWAGVLGVEATEDAVTPILLELRDQVDRTIESLVMRGVPMEVARVGFEQLKVLAAPSSLNAQWGGMKNYILPNENGISMTWAVWAMKDDDETDIDPQELKKLEEHIRETLQRIEESDLSSYLKQFCTKQLVSILQAIRAYGVSGARPLQEAMSAVTGSVILETRNVKAEQDKSSESGKGILEQAAAAIKKTAELCDQGGKIAKFGSDVVSYVGTITPLLISYGKDLLK